MYDEKTIIIQDKAGEIPAVIVVDENDYAKVILIIEQCKIDERDMFFEDILYEKLKENNIDYNSLDYEEVII